MFLALSPTSILFYFILFYFIRSSVRINEFCILFYLFDGFGDTSMGHTNYFDPTPLSHTFTNHIPRLSTRPHEHSVALAITNSLRWNYSIVAGNQILFIIDLPVQIGYPYTLVLRSREGDFFPIFSCDNIRHLHM